jgi:hypothetical protein
MIARLQASVLRFSVRAFLTEGAAVKIVRTGLVIACLALAATAARASIVTFNLTGVAGISGYVQYDSSYFHGFSFDYVPNTAIVGLNVDVFGTHFGFVDLVNIPGFSAAFMDTSASGYRIINGFGLFADNGVNAIAYFPDGWEGTPLDGDAALSFQTSCCFAPETAYAVRWTVASAPEPMPVVLVGIALLGLAAARRRI